MFVALQVVTATLIAVAMAMALAHALEFPGKLRLSKQEYYAVQPIYYPGFTIGGAIGEVGGALSTALLLFLTPSGDTNFWLTLIALLAVIAMQAVYWLFTHPVNKFWLKGENLDHFSSGFFSFGAGNFRNGDRPAEWTELRNRWEYSHVARASLGLVSLIMLLIAVAR